MSRSLTRRQSQVHALVLKGLSNREIAELLGVTLKTVKNHVYDANKKIDTALPRRRGIRHTSVVERTLEQKLNVMIARLGVLEQEVVALQKLVGLR